MSYQGSLQRAGIDVFSDVAEFAQHDHVKMQNGTVYPVVPPDAAVNAEAATATLAAGDFGKNNTNTGASGAIVLTLPAASTVKGKCLRMQITAAQQVSLSPAAADAVYLGGDGVDDKDLVIAGVIGNYADIYSDGTNYLVTGYSGVVTKEA